MTVYNFIKKRQVSEYNIYHTAQKVKFSMKDLSSKCDQIRIFLRIWSHLLEKSSMENFIFCAVSVKDSNVSSRERRYREVSCIAIQALY